MSTTQHEPAGAPTLTEIDGASWCIEHDAVWLEGDTRCSDRPSTFYECVEAPLFHGPAIGSGS